MMKMNPSWFMFILLSVFSLGLVVMSSNWFMVWMGFEISLLAFLPMFSVNSLSVEGMVNYFLVQSTGSAIFLLSFLVIKDMFRNILVVVSLLLKLGLFPFIQWVPIVMLTLSWVGCLVLTTLQKLSPLFLLMVSDLLLFNYCFIFMGALSVFFSGILAYNQNVLRLLMGYSSISHSGWVSIASLLNIKIGLFYVFIYVLMTIVLFLSFQFSGDSTVMSVVGGSRGLLVYFLILTLSGFPPFSVCALL